MPAGPAPATVTSATPPTIDKTGTQPLPPAAGAPVESAVTLHVNVNSLLVPAVVLDKNGDTVGDLHQADFVVMDNGKRRAITGFTLVKNASGLAEGKSSDGTKPTLGVSSAGALATVKVSAPRKVRYLIFLFDDRHMSIADLQIVKRAASRLFENPLPEGEYADVLSFMGADSGITQDTVALRSAVAKLTVHQVAENVSENCPNVDYYHANQIIRFHNTEDFQLAVHNARQCSQIEADGSSTGDLYSGIDDPNDPYQRAVMRAADNALALGDEDARESLLAVRNVVRVMSRLPGERRLILVSPGFLAFSEETMQLESEILDIAAASEVTVNTLDARGLAGATVDAGQGGTSLGLVTGPVAQERLASMQQSESTLSELAAGTGGRFFHENNDLQGGMEKLAAAPEELYLLEISLKDVKANGSYHHLRVKVDRPGMEVLARKGYAAPGKESNKK